MACAAGASRRRGLDEEDKAILRALKELGKPARPKEIAEKAGLNARSVAAKMRKLVNLGLVERVEEGVYKLTEEGEKATEQ
jgi:Mn-dependent DtxR family transcriptional regulator